MKKIKQLNNWIIKEKNWSELPSNVEAFRKFCVFSPTGIFQEDNLSYEEAVDFCKRNKDYITKK